MEMWELFLKGLAKTFEEFALKMIEKGKEKEPVAPGYPYRDFQTPARETLEPKPRPQSTTIEELERTKVAVLQILKKHPEGVTMKNIAKMLKVQWHFLRVPMKELQTDEIIDKKDLLYILTDAAGADNIIAEGPPAPAVDEHAEVEEAADEHAKVEVKSTPRQGELKIESVPADHAGEPVKQSETPVPDQGEVEQKNRMAAPRRRVIDAARLQEKPRSEPQLENLTSRDRERLRYRIMTALRGRPEGLNMDKLSAVLGMEIDIITPILNELRSESKILLLDSDKYKLP